MKKKTASGGFTLVELLVVVAIIGILALMAIVNSWLGLQRAKQKRTMEDMRTVATAWEARAADFHGYNAAGWSTPGTQLTFAQVDSLLAPTYTKSVSHVDGWARPIEFSMDDVIGGGPASVYAMRSAGSDGIFQGTDYTPGPFDKFDCDIVYSNGTFISYPQ